MLDVLSPSFMADIKIIFGCNFVAPLRTRQDFFLEIKKTWTLISDSVKLQITGHPFCLKFVLMLQSFDKFYNFLQMSPFNFHKSELLIKILLYSN